MAYGFYLIFFVVTALPIFFAEYMVSYSSYYYMTYTSGNIIYSYRENFYLFLLLNPVMYLLEFFGRVMMGESLVNELSSLSGLTRTGGPINLVATGNRWIIVSTILFLAVSFLFLWLAAKRINPIKRKAKKQAVLRVAQGAGQMTQTAVQTTQQEVTQKQAQEVLQVAQEIQAEKREAREQQEKTE